MEYIVGLSIFALVMTFAAMSGANEAMSKNGAGYSYREFSAFLNWYQKTFSHKSYMERVRKDSAWLEHELDLIPHKLRDDCSFCVIKTNHTGNASVAAINQINAFGVNSFRAETHGEYRYDALNDLYVNTWNNVRLTRQTYNELREQGRLGEVERKTLLAQAPKALETLNELVDNIDIKCVHCDRPDIHTHEYEIDQLMNTARIKVVA